VRERPDPAFGRIGSVTVDAGHTVEYTVDKSVASTERLHAYWTRGKGLAKWVDHVHPWTALRDHLAKFMDLDEANRTATVWMHEVTGTYPNSGKHH
jgi:hypothetical protein